MKIAEMKVGQLIAWVIYLLMFALVLIEPNQYIMSINVINDGPGDAVDGLMAFIGFVGICVLFVFFDLIFHLLFHHIRFRLSAIILLLFNSIYKAYEYCFFYSGYEGKYLTEDRYESVPTADDFVFFSKVNGIIVLYLVIMMFLSKLLGYFTHVRDCRGKPDPKGNAQTITRKNCF